MKILKRVLNDKRGFSLIEALAATVLVTIAASMSIGVFVASQRINLAQTEINKSQNSSVSSMETNLSSGGSTSNDTGRFTMTPSGGGGFASLDDGGRVEVNYDETSAGEVNYKIFKLYAP